MYWTHAKYPSRKYTGSYRIVKGEREMVLSTIVNRTKKPHNVVFESHEAAKKLGWAKK